MRCARKALDEKNLGAWATSVQERIPFLPYDTNPVLRLVRGIAHTSDWECGTPPPVMLIYAMVHIHMLCLYIGKTTLAPVSRLRKHFTNTVAHVDECRFHDLLRTTGLNEWTPVPLQYVSNVDLGCFVEREWWFRLRRWALNDVGPAVPSSPSSSQPSAHKRQRLAQLIHETRMAQQAGDYARKRYLSEEMDTLSVALNIPLVRTAVVKVPYLEPAHRACLNRCIQLLVRQMHISLPQRHAVVGKIVLARTAPLTVRRVFERPANKFGTAAEEPQCKCQADNRHVWEAAGSVVNVDGHFALVPVHIEHAGSVLRANDPLPCGGTTSYRQAVRSLQNPAKTLGVPELGDVQLRNFLPQSGFSVSNDLRERVRRIATDLSDVAVVRVVDKGPGQLWGFCKYWAWHQLKTFLQAQGYSRDTTNLQEILQNLRSQILNSGWPLNQQGAMALMYLIGNAKSRLSVGIQWRPIAAAAKPLITKGKLRIAARAFTCFVEMIVDELPAGFLTRSLHGMGTWIQKLGPWGAEVIGEADCKEQLNVIKPAVVVNHMKEAAAWLTKRKRWRASELVWSISKSSKKLDRAGQAAHKGFWVMSMDELMELVSFSLLHDNTVIAGGELWRRTQAIPMGGPFSAQSADLHSVWSCKLFVSKLSQLGRFEATPSGIVQWTGAARVLALQQFRDNLVVAAKGPNAKDSMSLVCTVMQSIWNLKVVCECRDKDDTVVCVGACMRDRLTAMGVTILLGAPEVCAHAHPNALNEVWGLKLGIPLQSFWAVTQRQITNMFTGGLCNVLPFLGTWSGLLVSATAWMQVALLSAYPAHVVRSSMICAMVRVLARTVWDVDMSISWINHIIRRLPQELRFTLSDLMVWL